MVTIINYFLTNKNFKSKEKNEEFNLSLESTSVQLLDISVGGCSYIELELGLHLLFMFIHSIYCIGVNRLSKNILWILLSKFSHSRSTTLLLHTNIIKDFLYNSNFESYPSYKMRNWVSGLFLTRKVENYKRNIKDGLFEVSSLTSHIFFSSPWLYMNIASLLIQKFYPNNNQKISLE